MGHGSVRRVASPAVLAALAQRTGLCRARRLASDFHPLTPLPAAARPPRTSGAAGQLQPDSVKYFVSAYQGSAAHRGVLLLLDLRWGACQGSAQAGQVHTGLPSKDGNAAPGALQRRRAPGPKQVQQQADPTTCGLRGPSRSTLTTLVPALPGPAAPWRWLKSWARDRRPPCPMPSCCAPAAPPAPPRRSRRRSRRPRMPSASYRPAWMQWWLPCSA